MQISKLEFSQEDAVRGKYAHFMLKEIYEQPRTVENALRGRVDHEGATAQFGGLNLTRSGIAFALTASSLPPAARAGTRRSSANI